MLWESFSAAVPTAPQAGAHIWGCRAAVAHGGRERQRDNRKLKRGVRRRRRRREESQ